jgi:Kef-type K+ transport system membrane component KefB
MGWIINVALPADLLDFSRSSSYKGLSVNKAFLPASGYFLRAGWFVSLPALAAAPLVFFVLLGGKVISKIFGLYPVIGLFRRNRDERWYYTLLMSTGLTFGTISSLYGLSHNIVTREQYSFLVTTVVASAVVPTLIAGFAFLPAHLLPARKMPVETVPQESGLNEEG